VIGGWMLGREALLTGAAAEPWLAAKSPLTRLYASQVLAQAPGLAAGVMAGGDDLEAVSAEALTG
jgi:hypothetical protein